jgi:hypothetical protein
MVVGMRMNMNFPFSDKLPALPWTAEEDQILLDNYKHGTKKCMEMLEALGVGNPLRNSNAIIGRAHRLHLTTAKGEKWKNYRRPVAE